MFKSSLPVVGCMYLVLATSCCLAGFTIEHQDVELDSSSNIADFVLTFNRQPDFYNLTSSGNPVDSFQYFIVDQVTENFPGIINSDSVIRGDEIHFANKITIRDITGPSDGNPFNGGFGPVRDYVDFNLEQNTLSFSVDYQTLACPDGSFSYGIMLTEDGRMSDWLYVGDIHAIPAPSALILAGIGLVALMTTKAKN